MAPKLGSKAAAKAAAKVGSKGILKDLKTKADAYTLLSLAGRASVNRTVGVLVCWSC